MLSWKIEDNLVINIYQLSNIRKSYIDSIRSFLPSTFYLLPSKLACGWAVYSLRMTTRISAVFIPSPAFCTHFVRRLWLTNVYYPLVIPASFPQKFFAFPSVNYLLYPLPTGLTIRATSICKLNNKTVRNEP